MLLLDCASWNNWLVRKSCTSTTRGLRFRKNCRRHSLSFCTLEDSVHNIQEWEDAIWAFLEKEATLRLRGLQYDKMTALRQENREAPLIAQDHSLWTFRPEEVMDESTATILDAHVAQLEREYPFLFMISKI